MLMDSLSRLPFGDPQIVNEAEAICSATETGHVANRPVVEVSVANREHLLLNRREFGLWNLSRCHKTGCYANGMRPMDGQPS